MIELWWDETSRVFCIKVYFFSVNADQLGRSGINGLLDVARTTFLQSVEDIHSVMHLSWKRFYLLIACSWILQHMEYFCEGSDGLKWNLNFVRPRFDLHVVTFFKFRATSRSFSTSLLHDLTRTFLRSLFAVSWIRRLYRARPMKYRPSQVSETFFSMTNKDRASESISMALNITNELIQVIFHQNGLNVARVLSTISEIALRSYLLLLTALPSLTCSCWMVWSSVWLMHPM